MNAIDAELNVQVRTVSRFGRGGGGITQPEFPT